MKLRRPGVRTLGSAVKQVQIGIPSPPKVADPHYSSRAHIDWRNAVVARAGGRCQDPDCQYPDRRGIRLFADHIVELKDGGDALNLANGLARCGSCHTRKTARERAKRMAQR